MIVCWQREKKESQFALLRFQLALLFSLYISVNLFGKQHYKVEQLTLTCDYCVLLLVFDIGRVRESSRSSWSRTRILLTTVADKMRICRTLMMRCIHSWSKESKGERSSVVSRSHSRESGMMSKRIASFLPKVREHLHPCEWMIIGSGVVVSRLFLMMRWGEGRARRRQVHRLWLTLVK